MKDLCTISIRINNFQKKLYHTNFCLIILYELIYKAIVSIFFYYDVLKILSYAEEFSVGACIHVVTRIQDLNFFQSSFFFNVKIRPQEKF